MTKLDISLLKTLEEFLLESTKLEEAMRWEKYVKAGEAMKENSLQHTYKGGLLGIMIMENEMKHSDKPFDAYLILKALLLHDIGEIETGDVVYIDKSRGVEEKERDFFVQFVSCLPEDIRKPMKTAYDLQKINKGLMNAPQELAEKYKLEAALFEATERLGYVIFAYREYARRNKEKILVQVLRNQHHHLMRLAGELPGFGKVFYTGEMQSQIEGFLKGYDGQYIEEKGE